MAQAEVAVKDEISLKSHNTTTIDKSNVILMPVSDPSIKEFQQEEDISTNTSTKLDFIMFHPTSHRQQLIDYDDSRQLPSIPSKEPVARMSHSQAKEMILTLFKDKGEVDYIDIMSSLNLDLDLIVEICDELEREKKIEAIS